MDRADTDEDRLSSSYKEVEEAGEERRTSSTNINEDEEDLIIRLHKLVGDRWSLIAGRIPGRTPEEIEKYWKSRKQENSKRKRGK